MDIKTPDLGVDKAEVIEILIAVGEQVSEGQSLFVVESSKASVEIPSPAAGVVQQIQVKLGDVVSEDVLLLILESAEASSDPVSKPSLQPEAKPAPAAAPKPDTTQPTPEPAPAAKSVVTAAESPAISTSLDLSNVYAGPAVRQAARQLGVDLSQVQPSGINQRVLKEDVYAHVKQRLSQPTPSITQANSTAVGLPPLPKMDKWGELYHESLSRLQQAAIQHLSLNSYIPQVTQFEQADITELEALRQQLKDDYKKSGVSLTVLAFIAKAVAHLLQQQLADRQSVALDSTQ